MHKVDELRKKQPAPLIVKNEVSKIDESSLRSWFGLFACLSCGCRGLLVAGCAYFGVTAAIDASSGRPAFATYGQD